MNVFHPRRSLLFSTHVFSTPFPDFSSFIFFFQDLLDPSSGKDAVFSFVTWSDESPQAQASAIRRDYLPPF